MVPVPQGSDASVRQAEPHRRLMAAVLQTVVDDCRGSPYRRTLGYPVDLGAIREAIVYATSQDRSWPFSFENLCDALGVDADCLRHELQKAHETRLTDARRIAAAKP